MSAPATRTDLVGEDQFAADNAELSDPAPNTVRIVFAGDSDVELWEPLPEAAGCQIVSRGLGGDRTGDLLLRLQRDVIDLKPAVGVVTIGGNDLEDIALLPEREDTLVTICERNIRVIVDRLRQKRIRVVLLTIFPYGDLPLFGLALFAVLLLVLYQELSLHSFRDISRRITATPWPRLAWVLGLTVLAYAVLPAYDFLGLRYVGRKVAAGRVALVSLLSFVFSNNVGFFGLSGAVQLRHYTSRGLSAGEVCQLSAFTTVSFWLGLFSTAGVMFVLCPLSLPAFRYIPVGSMRPIGAAFLLVVLTYLVACARRTTPVRLWMWEFVLPSFRLALGQLAIGSVDWLLAAAALYVLMPNWNALSFPGFFVHVLAGPGRRPDQPRSGRTRRF